VLQHPDLAGLGSSVDNLMTAARVLMEREERRRGAPRPPPSNGPKGRQKGDSRADSKKLPSQKFLDIEVDEEVLRPAAVPQCPCCHNQMTESGLFDISEKLEVIPKKFHIKRSKRVKYNCSSCHGAMVNTPAPPSIVPTSNYGDTIIIDVALSKFCSLIPIERYAQMAFQAGLGGELPAQSLIGLTHHLANFLELLTQKIKNEVLSSLVLQADESPHKMLEGDQTRNWFIWGFFSPIACYFQTHDTRSADIATQFLKRSRAKFLVTDGYQAYGKATRDLKESGGPNIQVAYCNAHAFRYFEEASITWKEESLVFLELYGQLYELEKQRKRLAPEVGNQEHLKLRQSMIPFFEQLKSECGKAAPTVMAKSQLEKAINYFLGHYPGLTLCTLHVEIPLDNNLAERELRSHVVGRKTWYGTHSKRGALTAASLFTIIHSCKLNKVNPYSYLPWVVQVIHKGQDILTPHEYSKLPAHHLSGSR